MDKLRSIEVFHEVVRRGSFSAAAESLQLVPSAVSRQVNELEQWLGVKLLHRTTRSLNLTAEGTRYLDRFESLLANVADLELEADRSRGDVSGTLRITTFPFMGDHLLQPVLLGFLREHPGVDVSLLLTHRKVSLIDEGYDLAVRVGDLPDSNLISRRIGTVRMRCAAAPNYLDARSRPREPQDLAHHNCLYDSILDRHNRRWRFLADDREVSVPIDGNLIVNNGEMVMNMAKAGVGVVYLPNFFLDEPIAKGELEEVLGEYNRITYPLSVIYPQNRHMSRAMRLFIDALVEYSESVSA